MIFLGDNKNNYKQKILAYLKLKQLNTKENNINKLELDVH
jgi:hypothetical protein